MDRRRYWFEKINGFVLKNNWLKKTGFKNNWFKDPI